MTSILKGFDNGVLRKPDPELATHVNWSEPSGLPIHRWYRYREGYSPRLIDVLDLGQSILDPFSGVGSIAVGAAQSGRTSVGIDVNPLAHFAAKVKLSPLSRIELQEVREFTTAVDKLIDNSGIAALPELKIAEKVFEPRILDTLLRLEATIEKYANSPKVRDFLWLARLAVLESVGSYFKEGNGIKYRRRKRLATGYVERIDGEWQRKRFGDDQRHYVLSAFKDKLSMMLADVDAWDDPAATWGQQEVRQGTCVSELDKLDRNSFDSVIFSPPYANRFDYFEAMKVELWFGRFVQSYDDMRALRKQSLRSHLGSDLRAETRRISEVDMLLDQMDNTSYATRVRVRDLVHGYFADMEAVLSGCREALRDGGRCHIIVGNSAYGGVIVPTDTILARLGKDNGFNSAEVTPVRHLTVAPQQRSALRNHLNWMRESVVTLE